MTLDGTVNKTGFLLALVMLSGAWTWTMSMNAVQQGLAIPSWPYICGLVGFGLVFLLVFKPNLCPMLAPVYAVLEGLFLGTMSATFELNYPGIAGQAIFLTFGILGALLLAYRSGLIKPSENFKLGIAAATGGIMLVYLISFGLSFFGISVPVIHESSPLGIAFSFFVVALASANLVLDFDFIENGVEKGAPKNMEWYGAFGLLVTLIWLYVEILRLLAKLNSRD